MTRSSNLPTPNFVLLQHGTTLQRAQRLLLQPPDENYIEPGGNQFSRAEAFSTVIVGHKPLTLGSARQYAIQKANLFPNEGGPVILEIEAPESLIDLLRADPISEAVLASGEARFEIEVGLAELKSVWSTLPKRIITL
jgi:hypothetical protein